MAKNAPKGPGRRGQVTGRSQFKTPAGNYAKRNTSTGRIMSQKAGTAPYKGVRKEK